MLMDWVLDRSVKEDLKMAARVRAACSMESRFLERPKATEKRNNKF